MDWFKNNPFLGGLAVATALLTGGAVYLTMDAQEKLSLQKEEFMSLTGRLSSLQGGKPFPSQANLAAAKAELEEAKKTFAEISAKIGAQSEPLNPSLSPQQFQDALNAKVTQVTKAAGEKGVTMPDDFYLGFDQYRSQPPSPGASPQLGQQLESITEAINVLLKNNVRSISSVTRPPLPVEGDTRAEKSDKQPEISLAPFDVEFVSDQSSFRQALDAIIRAEPLLFVRALQVINSNPKSPSKVDGSLTTPAPSSVESGGDPSAEETKAIIPVIFGQEQLTVRIRLSSISTPAAEEAAN